MFSNSASAHITGGKYYPTIDGFVTFKEEGSQGVLVTAKINGLPSSNTCSVDFLVSTYMKEHLAVVMIMTNLPM